ncbi:hypothetical protein ABE82_26140 (plasmid) [Paenibacillus peoriae]|nr:hypothetical protein ABE82_26140 [Paenibacillus peoriae]
MEKIISKIITYNNSFRTLAVLLLFITAFVGFILFFLVGLTDNTGGILIHGDILSENIRINIYGQMILATILIVASV